MDLPPEILTLAKASPWAPVAGLALWVLLSLLSPFVSILAIRLARNDKERAAFLEHRRIERRRAIRPQGRKSNDDEGEK